MKGNKIPTHRGQPTGIEPYARSWSRSEAIHLLRRTRFGFTKEDIDNLEEAGLETSLQTLLSELPLPVPPLNNYNTDTYTDPTVAPGETWIYAPFDPDANIRRRNSFNSWWMGQYLKPELNLREKMVLFWHNLLVTEASGVDLAGWIYQYNDLLRTMAFGNFKELIRAITLSPAMLRYLNGTFNSVEAPDENYARELLELFTCGKGPDSHYTEDDVKAAARVLTGFRINADENTYFFSPIKHDTGDKQFSAFFNNTLIQGQSGINGENELDELLDMIFSVDEVAKHICRKLYRFFVYYTINEDTEATIITPLADIIISNNYEILPALQTLLGSAHFFDEAVRGCFIKTPLDVAAGLIHSFYIALPTEDNLPLQYRAWDKLFSFARENGLELASPPNVAGWPAYYQEPMFHEIWINSDTISKRFSHIKLLLESGLVLFGNLKLRIIPTDIVSHLNDPYDPNAVIAELTEILYGVETDEETKHYMKSSFLLSGQTSDSYWTEAWADFANNPGNMIYADAVNSRLRGLFNYMLLQAEYQLS